MGCCQPLDQINYDFSSETVLKSYHLSNSKDHYNQSPLKNSSNKTTLDAKSRTPNAMVLRLNEFQTPPEKYRGKNWQEDNEEVEDLVNAHRNEDFAFLFQMLTNELKIETDVIQIEHKWAGTPRTVSELACVLIVDILSKYPSKTSSPQTLKEIIYVLQAVLPETIIEELVVFFSKFIEKKQFFRLEHPFLLLLAVMDYLPPLKDPFVFAKLAIDFILAFNSGVGERKIEHGFLALDLLQKVHENDENGFILGLVSQWASNILRMLWNLYENTIDLYSFDEQVTFWFRIVNFIDEITLKNGKRTPEIVERFRTSNVLELLLVIKEKIRAQKLKKGGRSSKREEGVLDYINFLFPELEGL